jgi:hypothetical protein
MSEAEAGLGQEAEGSSPPLRTGAEQPVDPEDLAMAQGKDPTPENVEKARQQLEEEGRVAVEKELP